MSHLHKSEKVQTCAGRRVLRLRRRRLQLRGAAKFGAHRVRAAVIVPAHALADVLLVIHKVRLAQRVQLAPQARQVSVRAVRLELREGDSGRVPLNTCALPIYSPHNTNARRAGILYAGHLEWCPCHFTLEDMLIPPEHWPQPDAANNCGNGGTEQEDDPNLL